MADFDLSSELLPEEAKEILTKKDSESLKPIVLGEKNQPIPIHLKKVCLKENRG